jgi:hypothetical protein
MTMWAPVVMVRGDTRTFTIALTDADGVAIDLTDAAVAFSVSGAFTKTTGDGVVVSDPTSGIALVTVEPADTDWMRGRSARRFDVQVTMSDGSIRTPISGRFVVLPDVTISAT